LVTVRPDLRVTLLEANRKKAGFLERVVAELGLNVRVIAGRAEEAAAGPPLREAYDIAAARAVAPLAVLAELTLPFLRIGGRAVLLKGPRIAHELVAARPAIETLGGAPAAVIEAGLRGGEGRTIVVVTKEQRTPRGFPRRPGVPQRHPL
jgi:16S rRNA (guanine527-N7)-methyltransferase